jgi:D-alanine-D-alanine ligase
LSLCPGEGLLGADVVFGALHGPFGEDGTVQGLLEMLDVPYVGAGVAASAVCLDKVLFKQLMSSTNTPQVDHLGVRVQRWQSAKQEVLREIDSLGLPVFVKPAHLGSSVGIAKMTARDELIPAIEVAFTHDPLVIVEALARGVEVECGVLGHSHAEQASGAGLALASEPGEITFAGEFYDYAAKYTPGVKELAVEAFEHAGCEGLARVDFFVDGEEVLVNELNTMPGFTPTSVYPKLMAASGISYPELLDRLCRLALERHEQRQLSETA